MEADMSVYRGAVVVGHDGSSHSDCAVQWGHEDAQRRGVPLVVLRAWTIKSAPKPATFEPGYVPSEDEFAEAVHGELAADVRSALGEEAGSQLVLLPVHESAKDALIRASEVAAVVVVASRGKGLARALLGSTSEQLIKHARGPVTVVPQPVA